MNRRANAAGVASSRQGSAGDWQSVGITGETRVVWKEPTKRFWYVRQAVLWEQPNKKGHPQRFKCRGRVVGWTERETSGPRRVFYLNDWDEEVGDPSLQFWPREAVDPRDVTVQG